MIKVEIIEFSCGMYGIRRTTKPFLGPATTEYFDLADMRWRDTSDYSYLKSCFSNELQKVKYALMLTGREAGIPLNESNIITSRELDKMHRMAATDEGMKDLLLKAKEFYLLKQT